MGQVAESGRESLGVVVSGLDRTVRFIESWACQAPSRQSNVARSTRAVDARPNTT